MFSFSFTATSEIYTLSLHDALPILFQSHQAERAIRICAALIERVRYAQRIAHPIHIAFEDRKSTRLNSSHSQISYAVFCLKKKMRGAAVERDLLDAAMRREQDRAAG